MEARTASLAMIASRRGMEESSLMEVGIVLRRVVAEREESRVVQMSSQGRSCLWHCGCCESSQEWFGCRCRGISESCCRRRLVKVDVAGDCRLLNPSHGSSMMISNDSASSSSLLLGRHRWPCGSREQGHRIHLCLQPPCSCPVCLPHRPRSPMLSSSHGSSSDTHPPARQHVRHSILWLQPWLHTTTGTGSP